MESLTGLDLDFHFFSRVPIETILVPKLITQATLDGTSQKTHTVLRSIPTSHYVLVLVVMRIITMLLIHS